MIITDKHTYFDLLEMENSLNIDLEKLETNYLKILNQFHPDRVKDLEQKVIAASVSEAVNQGYKILSNDLERRKYILKTRGVHICGEESVTKPAGQFLEEIFEIRAKIDETKNLEQLEKINEYASAQYQKNITLFDKLYLEEKIIDAGLYLNHALFYSKILEEISNKKSNYHANS